jgi:hypothetical protein
MAYIQIDDFKAGLDLRRLAYMTGAGSLLKARNVHINRGGEIEKRKALVSNATLPANTFGLLAVGSSLYVFGSVAAPAMPSGYTYQQLQDPDGSSMTGVIRARLYGGVPYVLATFANGARHQFYNGAIVTDWFGGIVRASMTNNSGIATHLASLIDAHPDYTASAVGAVITVTGPLGRAFTVTTATENGAALNDQTAIVATTNFAIAPIAETPSTGSFRITGGSVSAGVNRVSSVTVNGVTVTSGAIDYTLSNASTAAAIAANITSHVSSPDYIATSVGDTVYISAMPGVGAGANAFPIQVTCAGDVVVCSTEFTIVAGTNSAGVNEIDTVSMNGTVVANNVDWVTSHSVTATAVQAEINASPTYNAATRDAVVILGKLVSLSSTNLHCYVDSNGNVECETANNIEGAGGPGGTITFKVLSTISDLAGGGAAFAGTAQISTVTIGGTFEAGDKFTITINDTENGDLIFGVGAVAGEAATDILTMGTKMYAAFGPIAGFSAVDDPTAWNYGVGPGFISMATNTGGLKSIVGMEEYESGIAFFGREATQIWTVDPDPDLNAIFQTLKDIGTIAYRSLQSYGGIDTFFLHDSGVRSLRQRANTALASTYDIGTHIDDEIVAIIKSNPTAAAAAHSIIEPESNRYWLYLNSKIYVLTQFGAENISAWSTYEDVPAFTDFEKLNGKLYARAGDTVYLYGGADGNTYDDCEAEVTLPYLDARKKANFKHWRGLDIAASGLWEVYMNTDPNRSTTEDRITNYDGVTYHCGKDEFDAEAPAIKLRFVTTAASRALISGVSAHYDEHEAA